ncbi:hypothetical protein HNR74_002176 [Flammeovirga kamogawensis]|nr:hypothetical protein [Flammeovirga kamogawensis]
MVFFKRWSRKNYAIFNSLKKEIQYCILNVNLHLIAPAFIQEFTVDKVDYGESEDDDPPTIEELLLVISPLSISSESLVSSQFFNNARILCFIQKLRTYYHSLPPIFSHPRLISTHYISYFFSNDKIVMGQLCTI